MQSLKVNTHVNIPVMSCNNSKKCSTHGTLRNKQKIYSERRLLLPDIKSDLLSDIIDNIMLFMGKRTILFKIFEKEVIIS